MYIGTMTGVIKALFFVQDHFVFAVVGTPWKPTPAAQQGGDVALAARNPIAVRGGEEPLPLQQAVRGLLGGIFGPCKIYVRAEIKKYKMTPSCVATRSCREAKRNLPVQHADTDPVFAGRVHAAKAPQETTHESR